MKRLLPWVLALLLCPALLRAGSPSFYNILDYGALPGGCEQADVPINAAIAAASAAFVLRGVRGFRSSDSEGRKDVRIQNTDNKTLR
jgi:hypothetical protein